MFNGLSRLLLTLFLLAILVLAGCSGGAFDNAVTPDDQVQNANTTGNANARILWGIWQIEFDLAESEVTITPVRNALAHYNVTDWVLPPACDDCFSVQVNSFDPVTRILDADATLRNPTQLKAYDIRGILYTSNYGHELPNADGWTELWDVPGGNIINPFKAFAKDVEKRAFNADAENSENYQIYIPEPPNWNKITFAVDASWPGNCKEPYALENFQQLGQLYEYQGATVNIQVDAFDWQDDVNSIFLSAPILTGEDFDHFSPVSGQTWGLEVANATGLGPGEYEFFIAASSANSNVLLLRQTITLTITEFPATTVTAIQPESGYLGDEITGINITGTNFFGSEVSAKLVKNGGPDIVAENTHIDSFTTVSCDINIPWDVNVGLYDVWVSIGDAPAGIGEGLFDVLCPDPVVTGIDPLNACKGFYLDDVTITGENFIGPDIEIKLKLDGEPNIVALNIQLVDLHTINCELDLPQDAPLGFYDVEVINSCGGVGTGEALFEIVEAPDPVPIDVTPPWLNFAPENIWLDGDYAYIAGGVNGLHIFDISDPANPTWVNRVEIPGTAIDVAVSDGYACVVGSDLHIVDIDPPESAYLVNSVDGGFSSVSATSGYAYALSSGSPGLSIVDVDPPESAYVITSIGYGGSDVVVTDGLAYKVAQGDLEIIDIDPPGSPYILKTVEYAWGNGITVSGDYAYLSRGYGNLAIVDINPPESSYIVKVIDTTGGSYNQCAISGGYAYMADDHGNLQVIDIDPVEDADIVQTVNTHGSACGVDISGNYAFVADKYSGLYVVDISSPEIAFIHASAHTPGYAKDVAFSGNFALVANAAVGMQIFDISTPESTTLIRQVASNGGAGRVAVIEDYAYLADGHSGLVVIDIDPPESAHGAKTISTPGIAHAVDVAGGYAYVADDSKGMAVIDIDPLYSADVNTTLYFPGKANNVVVRETYAFIATGKGYPGDGGLVIVDIESPEDPQIIKHVNEEETYQGLAISGNYAFLSGDYMRIIDITYPEIAHPIKSISCPGQSNGITVHGGYAYVADGGVWDAGVYHGEVQIVDVDPISYSAITDTIETPGRPLGVEVHDGYLYIADWEGGLRIYKLW